MKNTYKKDYPLIFKVEGKLYRSFYGKWRECDNKDIFLSRISGKNVVKFRNINEKK